MRKLVDYMFISLDGLIADAEGTLDWIPDDGELTGFANEYFGTCDGIVFGRKVYQAFVEYWDGMDRGDPSNAPHEVEFARVFEKMARIVVTTTLGRVDDPRAILIKDDVPAAIEDLKRQPGRDLLLIAGPNLRSTLTRAGLVDQYRLLVVPRVLGRGVPLFGDLDGQLRLRLVGTPKVFEDHIVMLDYEPQQ